ncbi:MAG: hypothetical protein K6T99_04660 [Armatimonadetes bacterium]|nr:hypothetical protein [Armatimonadota bacterium]
MSNELREAIQAGRILRNSWPLCLREHVNLYIGSGRAGACFDAYGLMNNGFRGKPSETISNTRLMHADHWHRGAWGLDYWLPVARIAWATTPHEPPLKYRQELDIYEGRLRTQICRPSLRYDIASYFHPYRRDLLAIDLRFESIGKQIPDIIVSPETDVHTHYNQHLIGKAQGIIFDSEAKRWICRIKVGNADSFLCLRIISTQGDCHIKAGTDGLNIRFEGESGSHLLLVGVGGAHRKQEIEHELDSIRSPEQFAAEAAQAWHRRWGDAFINIPVPQYQALWARSLFYVLSSYAPDVRAPAPPNGWSGNCWPFGFPQDLSFIHPALLRLGHLDIARSWVEFYRQRLQNMQEYTRRVYGAEGAMWAWEFPIGPDSKLLSDGYPNYCQFEIHNAAYPARMAREAAMHIRNQEWTLEVAWPIVKESARFFGSILKPEDDRTWGIQIKPSMGQDEMGGINAKNYLCALFSAHYALKIALEMAEELDQHEPEFDRWKQILTDGLAFKRLYDETSGVCATCEGQSGSEQIGKEKHPVQLNPLIFLPMRQVDDHVLRAYERRYDICAGVRENIYYGWTLAAYLLAASHMKDADGLLHELGQFLRGKYVDPDWIQIYETSGAVGSPFYVTSHGLYLQALNDALVSDYWGETQIGASCPKDWIDVSFHRLRTADGCIHSGQKVGEDWKVSTEERPV